MTAPVVVEGTGEVVAGLEAGPARELTEQIAAGIGVVWQLVKQAYEGRAWSALGYGSWDDYCSQEFGGSRLALPREDRQEVIGSLREAGLSVRAIAAATGTSRGTVGRELAAGSSGIPDGSAGVPNGTPDPPAKTTGTDGKQYKRERVEDPLMAERRRQEAERKQHAAEKRDRDAAAKERERSAETELAARAVEEFDDVRDRTLNVATRDAIDALMAISPQDAAFACPDSQKEARLLYLDQLAWWVDEHRTFLNPPGATLHSIGENQ